MLDWVDIMLVALAVVCAFVWIAINVRCEF